MATKTGLLQGTLDLLILQALSLESQHGLGVARRISQITTGAYDIGPGSLFPALHRLQEQGWLTSKWGESANNRKAKFYTITKAGRRQLELERREWDRIALAMTQALASTS